MADMITIMNTIRDNGLAEYGARVPVLTQTNLSEVGSAILQYPDTTEQFLSLLVNRIAMVIVEAKTFSNPLNILKKGGIPLGNGVQDIYVNPAKAKTFDPSGLQLLEIKRPDVKVIYHTMNRKDQYVVSFTKEQLKQAFVSMGDLNNLLTATINSLYSGDNMDEFILTKNLIADSITKGLMKNVTVGAIDTVGGVTSLVKSIKKVSSLMAYANSNFNSYLDAQPAVGGDTEPVITWTPKPQQLILIRSDVMVDISVDVLAAAFNLSKVEFLSRLVEVDSFGTAVNTLAMLCDESYFKIFDNEKSVTNFTNPSNLTTTFFYNHWQTYSVCTFANAVAFSLVTV